MKFGQAPWQNRAINRRRAQELPNRLGAMGWWDTDVMTVAGAPSRCTEMANQAVNGSAANVLRYISGGTAPGALVVPNDPLFNAHPSLDIAGSALYRVQGSLAPWAGTLGNAVPWTWWCVLRTGTSAAIMANAEQYGNSLLLTSGGDLLWRAGNKADSQRGALLRSTTIAFAARSVGPAAPPAIAFSWWANALGRIDQTTTGGGPSGQTPTELGLTQVPLNWPQGKFVHEAWVPRAMTSLEMQELAAWLETRYGLPTLGWS